MSNLTEFSAALVAAAPGLGIQIERWGGTNTYRVTRGGLTRVIRGAASSLDTPSGIDTACDKIRSYELCNRLGVLHPGYTPVGSLAHLTRAAAQINAPVVVKPVDTECGRGVSTEVTAGELAAAWATARAVSDRVLVQRHIYGREFRITVLGGRVEFVIERTGPANQPKNLARGGGRVEVPDHPAGVIAIRLAAAAGLHAVGVDVIDTGSEHYVLELNSMPVLYPHRAAAYLESLFTQNRSVL